MRFAAVDVFDDEPVRKVDLPLLQFKQVVATPHKTNANRQRINVHDEYELHYWSKEFGVSHDELRRTVSKRLAIFEQPTLGLPRSETAKTTYVF